MHGMPPQPILIMKMNIFQIPTEEYTVPRFDKTERVLHWLNAAFYLILLITGFTFAFPLFGALSFGHPKTLLICHVFVGVGLGALLIYVYFFKKSRIPLSKWHLHFSYLKSNKYNMGQKLNITMAALFLTIFLISGILLVLGRVLPRAILEAAYYAHNLGVVLMVPLIMGHLFLSIIFPVTNRSLFAMLIGKVEERYARHHHPEWFEEISRTSKSTTNNSSQKENKDLAN